MTDKVKEAINKATELTAISVYRLIEEHNFTPEDLLEEEESIKREKLIDQAGVDAMYAALTDIPFVLEVVGSEGRKHVHQYGEALPTLMGTFGSGEHKYDCVNDVVEGSKAAKLNSPGAVSVMALGSHRGLMPTPDDSDYMDKLFAPPQLRGKLSLLRPVEENLAEVVNTFKVKPHQISVVVLERDRNARYINACQKFGVNLTLIKAGDFLPSVLACIDPHSFGKGPHLVIGSGGFEEGILAAVAGKALGAMVEGRGWSADPRIQARYTQVWSVDELVSGDLKDCLVSVSAITGDNKWFDLDPVKEKNNGHEVTTLTVSESGVKINRRIHR